MIKYILLLAVLISCQTVAPRQFSQIITMHYGTNRIVEIIQSRSEWLLALTQAREEGKNMVPVKTMASVVIESPQGDQEYTWFECRFTDGDEPFNPMETPIVGLLPTHRQEGLNKPDRAWIVDYLQQTIKEVEADSVRCNHVAP